MHDRVRIVIDGRPPVMTVATPPSPAELGLRARARVRVSVKAVDIGGYCRASRWECGSRGYQVGIGEKTPTGSGLIPTSCV
jgi:hypothetical protein